MFKDYSQSSYSTTEVITNRWSCFTVKSTPTNHKLKQYLLYNGQNKTNSVSVNDSIFKCLEDISRKICLIMKNEEFFRNFQKNPYDRELAKMVAKSPK
ncbi:hypothetical protein TNCV_2776431 [Trichonephila clavipes]|nr:hypothetical protein TNCV_2776431 [Trichonephila clavipes]